MSPTRKKNIKKKSSSKKSSVARTESSKLKKVRKQKTKTGSTKPWYKKEISLGSRTSVEDVVLMAKHMSVMLSAGLTLPESLGVIAEQANGNLKRVLKRVLLRVQQGDSFSDATESEPSVFSPVFVSAVVVGENSGTLAENLDRLAVQMEKDFRVRRNIQSAMLYPAIVIVVTLVLGFAIATYVLPQISDVFTSLRADLPFSTRVLMGVADIFDQYGVWISIAFFALIAFLYWLLRQKFMRPIIDPIILKLPPFGLFVHSVQRARFCRVLSTLLLSGTPIAETLDIAKKASTNHVYRRSIARMKKRVGSGDNFAEVIALYPHLYPPIIIQMVTVGEQSGSLGDSFGFLADFYEERVEIMAKNVSSIIEPVLLIGIGLIVGLLAVSILTPIYSILGNLR